MQKWFQWKGEDIRNGCKSVSMVETVCSHIWKLENGICGKCSANGGQENDGGGEIN
jgi:hypothetical protein